jgi:hypothetical protein
MIQNHQFAILLPLLVGMGAHALNDFAIITLVISVAFVAHLVEIGLWAILLVLCKEFQELGTAYYHSAVNYTTLGYGDLLSEPGVAFAGTAGGNERSPHVRCFGRSGLCRCAAVGSGQVSGSQKLNACLRGRRHLQFTCHRCNMAQ